MTSRTVYITIGNTDNNLTQQAWSQFCIEISNLLDPNYGGPVSKLHGNWYSLPNVPWQNACWCVEISAEKSMNDLKNQLVELAADYYQDSIAFAVAEVEMISPNEY